MRIPRILAAAVAAMAIGSAGLFVAVRPSDAQMNTGSFHALIAALNADDQAAVQVHLAPNFTLSFAGGSTLTGSDAVQVLMLLDTPITIVSANSGGNSQGSAVLTFGNDPTHYTVNYTGARGSKFASWSVSSGTSSTSGD